MLLRTFSESPKRVGSALSCVNSGNALTVRILQRFLKLILMRESIVLLFSTGVVIASATDLLSDLRHGAPLSHLAQEGALMGLAALLAVHLVLEIRRRGRQIRRLTDEMRRATQLARKRDVAVNDARQRLADAVNRQFAEWAMSPSEQEVGWLLLKGLSIREIASLRQTQEKTVRQQASAIYRKAELPGRHAFAAWFLEDLL